MKLDQDQIDRFHKEGYLFLPQAFSAEEVGVLRRRADAIFRMDREEVWRETSRVARTAFAAHTYDDGFRRLGAHPRLVEPVMQLLDGPVYMHQFKRSEEHTSETQSLMRIS